MLSWQECWNVMDRMDDPLYEVTEEDCKLLLGVVLYRIKNRVMTSAEQKQVSEVIYALCQRSKDLRERFEAALGYSLNI